MRVGGTEHFAAEMLTLAPTVTVCVDPSPRPCSLAVWIGRLYGSAFNEALSSLWDGRGHALTVTLGFTRNDEPGARRRAEWLRNPARDPGYPPPVVWHMNGGVGFRPPGWHPDVRLVITPEIEASLRYNDAQFARRLRNNAISAADEVPPAFAKLPPLPPAPPPPSTIAFPDERGAEH